MWTFLLVSSALTLLMEVLWLAYKPPRTWIDWGIWLLSILGLLGIFGGGALLLRHLDRPDSMVCNVGICWESPGYFIAEGIIMAGVGLETSAYYFKMRRKRTETKP